MRAEAVLLTSVSPAPGGAGGLARECGGHLALPPPSIHPLPGGRALLPLLRWEKPYSAFRAPLTCHLLSSQKPSLGSPRPLSAQVSVKSQSSRGRTRPQNPMHQRQGVCLSPCCLLVSVCHARHGSTGTSAINLQGTRSLPLTQRTLNRISVPPRYLDSTFPGGRGCFPITALIPTRHPISLSQMPITHM